MFKKIISIVLWTIGIFVETLTLSLIRINIPQKLWFILSGFGISLLLGIGIIKNMESFL